MPGRREAATREGRLHVQLRVEALAAADRRRDEPVLLEVTGELAGDAGALAQLGEVDLRGTLSEIGLRPPSTGRGEPRRELVADDAQREELVALEPEDRLEPVDVVLARTAGSRPACGAETGGPGPRGT